MKIFYSVVSRANSKVRITINSDSFLFEQAYYRTVFDATAEEFKDVAGDYEPELACTIRFDEVRSRDDIADHTALNIPESTPNPALFNFWAATKAAKETGAEFAKRSGFNSVASLVIPFKDSPVEDWVLGVHVKSADDIVVINATANEHPVDAVGGLGSLREIFSPSIKFDVEAVSGEAESVVEVPFTVMNSDGSQHDGASDVYLEVTGGNLLMSRVRAINGKGIARVSLLHMQAGDEFKVKAGFKYYSGVCECKITVQ